MENSWHPPIGAIPCGFGTPPRSRKLCEEKAPGYIGLHLSISADGKTLATAGRRIMVWDLPAGKPRHHWDTHGENVHSVAFSPTGEMLVSAGIGGIYCWDAATGRMLRHLSGSDDRTGFMALSHDGKTIAAGVGGNEIRLWDVASGKATLLENVPRLQGYNINPWSIDFRAGDNLLAMGLVDGTVRLWDRLQHKEVQVLDQATTTLRVRFSPDGKVCGGVLNERHSTLRGRIGQEPIRKPWCRPCRRRAGEQCANQFKELVVIPHSASMMSPFDFVPGSTLIAVPVCDRDAASRQSPPNTIEDRTFRVRLWDYAHAKSHWESQLLELPRAICASPDGRLLAASTFLQPRPRILIWSVKSGKLLKEFHGHEEGISALAFSRDGARLASAGADATLLIWDVSKLRE